MFHVALCDDEKHCMDIIESFIVKYFDKKGFEYKVSKYLSGTELWKSGQHFDIIFLDIEMEGDNGIVTAENIRKYDMNVPIVFVTNYVQYLRAAYKVHAFQYLDKPISEEKVKEILDDFLKLINSSGDKKILVTANGVEQLINQSDIVYFLVKDRRTVTLCTRLREYDVKETITEIYDKLDKDIFFMTHRSCIVNLRCVQRIDNKFDIIMINDKFCPLAQKKKTEFVKHLSTNLAGILRGV
ncbi:MAG: LytR/AlgR family response regulator transcription factor [Butyrivibrio sp.]